MEGLRYQEEVDELTGLSLLLFSLMIFDSGTYLGAK